MYGIPLIFATGVIVSLMTPADAARSAAGGRSSGNG
jgi:hypothetical protein